MSNCEGVSVTGIKDDSVKVEIAFNAVAKKIVDQSEGSPLSKAISDAIAFTHLANLDISINGEMLPNTSCDILRLVNAVKQLRLSAILAELEAGVPCMVVAKHFDITPSRVSQIRRENKITTIEKGEENA